MGDNTNYLFSFVLNKTENQMYIKIVCHFIQKNSLLLLYVTRLAVNHSNNEGIISII